MKGSPEGATIAISGHLVRVLVLPGAGYEEYCAVFSRRNQDPGWIQEENSDLACACKIWCNTFYGSSTLEDYLQRVFSEAPSTKT